MNRIGAGRLYHIAALLDVPVAYFYNGLGDGAEAESADAAVEFATIQEAFSRISDPARAPSAAVARVFAGGGYAKSF